MTIRSHDVEPGGRVLVKTRHQVGGTGSYKMRPARVITVDRAACTVETLDDGERHVFRYNELSPDEDWLSERDARERDKHARMKADQESSAPALRVVDSSLAASMQEHLQQRAATRPSQGSHEPRDAEREERTSRRRRSEPPQPPLAESAELLPSFAAWLEAGRRLLVPQAARMEALDTEIDELETRLEALRAERARLAEEHAALETALSVRGAP